MEEAEEVPILEQKNRITVEREPSISVMERKVVEAKEEEAGQRLDAVVRDVLVREGKERISRRSVQHLIEKQLVEVNGRNSMKPTYKIKLHDKIAIQAKEGKEEEEEEEEDGEGESEGMDKKVGGKKKQRGQNRKKDLRTKTKGQRRRMEMHQEFVEESRSSEEGIVEVQSDVQEDVPCSIVDGLLQINGSFKEGGGQILRNCIAISALLEKPIHIMNIRGKRSSKGLKPQHMAGIQLVAEMYRASLEGCQSNSTELTFKPHTFKVGHYVADTQSAGSITLMIQTALPCLLFAPTKMSAIELKGGTNVEFAPHIDYLQNVFQPIVGRMGVVFYTAVRCRGYFPRGGGVVTLAADPVHQLKSITLLERGHIQHIHIRASVAGTVSLQVGQRISSKALEVLMKHFTDRKIRFGSEVIKENKSTGNGVACFITCKTDTGCLFGGSSLGGRNVTAEKVGKDAANSLIKNLKLGGCVDEFLQDQLIIYCALAKGTSKFRSGPLTLHTETAIHFASCLTGAKFKVTKTEDRESETDKSCIIHCEGVGLTNSHIE